MVNVKNKLLRPIKEGLTRVGATTPEGALHQMQMVINYMRLGRWMATHGFLPTRRVADRRAVFDVVAQRVASRPVLYLEFGVYRGKSLRYWSEALEHPDTQLHGFDSFEGLPEDFDVDGPYRKGTFDVGGRLPDIDDPRVHFHKGWFEETVPAFTPPEHEQLIICLDADLYSSTKIVLDHLRPWIVAGTYIYFDDMSRPDHEPRAFDEFIRETGRRFELVVADRGLNAAFFRCIG